MSAEAIDSVIQTCFTAELEAMKSAKAGKGGKKRGKSTSDPETERLVFDVIEVIAPMLIKTMSGALEHHGNILRQDFSKLQAIVIAKDERIRCLEQRVNALEAEADKCEQYSRRPNLRIHGIPEADKENTNDLVIAVIKDKMGLMNIGVTQLERSHRLGPKTDKQGHRRKRPIIVRFKSESTRDEVFRARTQLKEHNKQKSENPIFINEDLTAKRAALAFQTRTLKRKKLISDCWTFAGRVLVKTNAGLIKEIHTEKDLDFA